MASKQLQRDQYTVGWVCALPIETAAAMAMLDETHESLPLINPKDSNSYVLGRVGEHNVAITSLPKGSYGTTSAAVAATNMLSSFPSIRFGLMVGVGGGIPSEDHDIRLGDVVVSQPTDTSGGVIQIDLGKETQQGFKRTGSLNRPPTALLTALTTLEARHFMGSGNISTFISDTYEKHPGLKGNAAHPGPDKDVLFEAEYDHPNEKHRTCKQCDVSQTVDRDARQDMKPAVHYGIIASSNSVIKNGRLRDELQQEYDALCFEMEAAGLMNDFPCLVIRGICDYSDSHKNKAWQPYAALVAAAYAKKLLDTVVGVQVEATTRAADVVGILHDIQEDIDDIKIGVMDSRRSQHHKEVHQWLSPADPEANYHRALRTRHPGSGAWFLHGEEFLRWKQCEKPSLWVHGLAGCGKTVLSSTIISAIISSCEHGSASRPIASVLYFYFDFSNAGKQSVDAMIRSLISQLYDHNMKSRPTLDALYKTHRDGRQAPSTEAMLKAFTDMLATTEEIFVIIDALDECTKREELLAWLEKFARCLSNGVRLLVTSRKEADIDMVLEQDNVMSIIIALQAGRIDEDISAYVQHTVEEDPRFQRWKGRKDVQDEIKTHLTHNANGMFRWAACQLDALSECIDRQMLREALKSLPRTLDETYARILRSIRPAHLKKGIRILQLLTYSRQLLSVKQLIDAVAVNVTTAPYFDFLDRMLDAQGIKEICSSLITFVAYEKSQHGDDYTLFPKSYRMKTDDSQVVQLAHFSVKQYLISDQTELIWKDNMSESKASICNAKLCLAYYFGVIGTPEGVEVLKAASSGAEKDLREGIESCFNTFPFAKYSIIGWTGFAEGMEYLDEELCQMIKMLPFQDEQAFITYARLRDYVLRYQNTTMPLHFALEHNLSRTTRLLLERITNVDAVDKGLTALGLAAKLGFADVVRTLIDRGAKCDVAGADSALSCAAAGGHSEIAKYLLDHGAEVDAVGDYYTKTALIRACERGDESTFQVLIDAGADPNRVTSGIHGTALIAAVSSGHSNIAHKLLNLGVNINALCPDGDFGHALGAAIELGSEEMCSMLLARGADPNLPDNDHMTPIVLSSQFETWSILEMLIEAGADVNKADGEMTTALHYASRGCPPEILLALHEAGADFNIPDNFGRTPLHYSFVSCEDSAHVQRMIELGADPNIVDHYGYSPLHLAARQGFGRSAKVLLHASVDCNLLTKEGKLPMHLAAEEGHADFIEMLLTFGSELNTQDLEFGQTPLHCAVSGSHIETVKILVKAGADCNLRDVKGLTPLHLAARYDNFEILGLLLAAKSIVDSPTSQHEMTPLHYAARQGHLDMITALVEAGSNVDLRDHEQATALHYAAYNGWHAVVDTLVRAGACVDPVDIFGNTPLDDAVQKSRFEVVMVLLKALSKLPMKLECSTAPRVRRNSLPILIDLEQSKTSMESGSFGDNNAPKDSGDMEDPPQRCISAPPVLVTPPSLLDHTSKDDDLPSHDDLRANKRELDQLFRARFAALPSWEYSSTGSENRHTTDEEDASSDGW